MLTTTKTAEKLNVTNTTILRWVKRFSPHLSTGATPEKGTRRMFSDADVELLVKIQQWYADKKTTVQINELLGTPAPNSAENTPPLQTATQPPPDSAESPPPVQPAEMIALAEYRTIEGDLQTAQAVAATIAKERDRLVEKLENMQEQLIESETKRGELTGQINTIKAIQTTQKTNSDKFLYLLIVVVVVILCVALYFGLRGV